MNNDEVKLQFYRDVISSDRPAPIPSNLSDYWINYLLAQGEKGQPQKKLHSELFAVVLKILYLKHGESFETSEDELRVFLDIFLTELALEKICRVMGIEMTKATIDTILTDREIGMSSASVEQLLRTPQHFDWSY
jgi:hypothetical protein